MYHSCSYYNGIYIRETEYVTRGEKYILGKNTTCKSNYIQIIPHFAKCRK